MRNAGDTWAHVNPGRNRAEVLSKKEKTKEDFVKALKGAGYVVKDCEKAGNCIGNEYETRGGNVLDIGQRAC